MDIEANSAIMGGEIALFQVGEMLCGVDTLHVREINQNTDITKVYRAPDYVRGVINLRGEIVTVIDLRSKFDLNIIEINEDMQIVVVRHEDENIGLLVDLMHDVVTANSERTGPPPSNVGGVPGTYFAGIFQMDKELVAILDLTELLKK